jgi:hypothetical protein
MQVLTVSGSCQSATCWGTRCLQLPWQCADLSMFSGSGLPGNGEKPVSSLTSPSGCIVANYS